MTQTHPITPPPELLEHWEDQHYEEGENYDVMLIQAYQAGADQELEACVNWLADPCAVDMPLLAKDLRYSRRPQPPSLKERSLQLLETYNTSGVMLTADQSDTIRRALEALDD
jgi:hypothetical protein